MAERPAVNASPLIYLSRAGLLDLLQLAGPRVVVPRPVADEINRHGERDVTAQALAATDWIDIVDALPIPALIRAWDLGDGESSVLAWGRAHAETELIIDDLAARRCAAALGIPVRGTLGLVLVAKRRGRVASARSTLDQLRIAGMYLADDVLNAALRLVGE